MKFLSIFLLFLALFVVILGIIEFFNGLIIQGTLSYILATLLLLSSYIYDIHSMLEEKTK